MLSWFVENATATRPGDINLRDVLELAHKEGVDVVTLDDVAAYARKHDLVLWSTRHDAHHAPNEKRTPTSP